MAKSKAKLIPDRKITLDDWMAQASGAAPADEKPKDWAARPWKWNPVPRSTARLYIKEIRDRLNDLAKATRLTPGMRLWPERPYVLRGFTYQELCDHKSIDWGGPVLPHLKYYAAVLGRQIRKVLGENGATAEETANARWWLAGDPRPASDDAQLASFSLTASLLDLDDEYIYALLAFYLTSGLSSTADVCDADKKHKNDLNTLQQETTATDDIEGLKLPKVPPRKSSRERPPLVPEGIGDRIADAEEQEDRHQRQAAERLQAIMNDLAGKSAADYDTNKEHYDSVMRCVEKSGLVVLCNGQAASVSFTKPPPATKSGYFEVWDSLTGKLDLYHGTAWPSLTAVSAADWRKQHGAVETKKKAASA